MHPCEITPVRRLAHLHACAGQCLMCAVEIIGSKAQVVQDIEQLIKAVTALARPGDHVLIMSNGAFGGIHDKLTEALKK